MSKTTETRQEKNEGRLNRFEASFDMKGRAYLPTDVRYEVFFNEFPEFKNLEIDKIDALIALYDANLSSVREFSQPHLIVFGSLFLCFCQLMFNVTNQFVVTGDAITRPEKIITNTMVTATFAGITHLITQIRSIKTKTGRIGLINPIPLVNSIAAGLCASSGTAKFVTVSSSAIIGIVAAICYHECIRLLERIEIDDPV
jgi:Ammonium Transporter Family